MGGLSDLCFAHGLEFERVVDHRFNCSVSPTSYSSPSNFHLLLNFGRSAIRLNEYSVALILQACLVGVAKDFNVCYLSDWMFKFTVSCKKVGLMVYKLNNFSCKSYSLFFALWREGGPNWRKQYDLFCKEQDDEWTLVGAKGKIRRGQAASDRRSYADIVRSSPRQALSVFKRLSFPADYNRNYESQNFGGLNPISPSISNLAPNQARVHRWVIKNPLESRERTQTMKIVITAKAPSPAPTFSKATPLPISGPDQLGGREGQCRRCLGPGHKRKDCTRMVRCILCYNYGHTSLTCLSKIHAKRRYRVVSRSEVEGTLGNHLYPKTTPPLVPSPPISTVPASVTENPTTSSMANWPYDPVPHLPPGFSIQEPPLRNGIRQEVFVIGCYTLYNEDLAIIKLQPPVSGDDFGEVKTALRSFFQDVH